MQVLVFNAGSASLKFDLVDVNPRSASPSEGRKLVSAIIEGIGADKTTISLLNDKDIAEQHDFEARDYGQAAANAVDWLRSAKQQGSRSIDLVGHRVVHGADRFDRPAVIDAQIIAAIAALDKLAPLHNQPAVEVIQSTQKVLGKNTPMVAVFDTVFHQSIPHAATTYALPYELSQKHRIRRYGFHGISHRYLAIRFAELTKRPLNDLRLITMHLESGASICAIDRGQSVEISMGFTPLEGLVMGKRCGDLDPAIVGFLLREEGITIDELEKMLNGKSGLLGLSGISHDTRDLMKHLEGNDRVRLAFDVFCHRIRKYIGAYLAVLNGADAVIFGGGIGEDSPWVRERICRDLDGIGLQFDAVANESLINQPGRISTADSRLQAWVIPTEEAMTVAWEAAQAI